MTSQEKEDRRLGDDVTLYSQAKYSRYRMLMAFAMYPTADPETRESTMPMNQMQRMADGPTKTVMATLADLEEMGEIEILEVKVRIRTYEGVEPRFDPATLDRE